MKKVFQLMAMIVVSLMLVTSASAYTGVHNLSGGGSIDAPHGLAAPWFGLDIPEKQQVSIAENGVGDLLIFPLFVAVEGVGTQIKVVNTCPVNSQIAKVVFREYDNSEEVRNFYIFLSPNDAWYGNVIYDGQNIILRTTDDSYRIQDNVWASEARPHETAFLDRYDTEWMGYATVFNVMSTAYFPDQGPAAIVLNATTAAANAQALFTGQRIDKERVYEFFRIAANLDFITPNPLETLAQPDIDFPQGQRNVLTGKMELVFGNNAAAMGSLRAVAFKDYNVTEVPAFGDDMTIEGSSAWTSLDEVEAVLAKQRVMMPFVNTNTEMSLHMFTFPTKYDGLSTFFDTLPVYKELPYSMSVYDMKETLIRQWESPSLEALDKEVWWVSSADLALDSQIGAAMPNKGWIDYEFDYATSVTTARFDLYNALGFLANINIPLNFSTGDQFVMTGAPVIPVNLTFTNNAISLSYGAHGDSYYPVTGYPLAFTVACAAAAGYVNTGTAFYCVDAFGDPLGSVTPGNVTTGTLK